MYNKTGRMSRSASIRSVDATGGVDVGFSRYFKFEAREDSRANDGGQTTNTSEQTGRPTTFV